jgi:hypothetical protein
MSQLMRKLAMIICSTLAASPGQGQISANELTYAAINDCMKEAIGTGSVDSSGAIIVFFCNAEKAKTLYNFLGRKVHAEIVQDRNGKFENRQFGNNACYHRNEDANGKFADEFRCDLILVIGDTMGNNQDR